MTVAKGMKSPGQKLKSPKGPATPKVKSPHGKGPATPKGTPSAAKTPKGTPMVAKTPKGTPKVAKTPKGTPMVAKTPKETPKVAKTPKESPKVAKTPKETPKAAKALNGTPKVAKTPNKPAANGTPKGPKTPAVAAKQSPKATPKVAKTPVVAAKQSPKGTPAVAKKAPVNKQSPKAVSANNSKPVQQKQTKRSASAAGLDKENTVFRTITIFNVPDVDSSFPKIRQLLEPRGEILSMKRFQSGIRVTFNTPEEARAAKKLNGVVFSGKNLSISHVDDKNLPVTNQVVLSNIPTDITDQDVWTAFGNCGKILNIHMNRSWKTKHVQRTIVTFETPAGAKAALNTANTEIRGKQVKVSKNPGKQEFFPIENTIYLSNIRLGVEDNDIKAFLKSAGPVSGVQILEGKTRLAMAYMTNAADVEKAVKLSGTTLKNSPVTITRHRKSTGYSAPSPVKKQKLNEGGAKAKQAAVEVDSDEDEDDDDDEDDDASEEDLLAFQGQLQKLKAAAGLGEDEDDDDEDEDDEDDDEDVDEEEDDEDGEEEEDDDEDDEDDDEDDDDDDDE